jgi:hypothetical protein
MEHAAARPVLVAMALALTCLASACATRDSVKARPLQAESVDAQALAPCMHLTVAPFALPAGSRHTDIGESFARDVATRLATNFPGTFTSVEFAAAPRGLAGECLLQGTLSQYKPGSRAVRALPFVGGMLGGAKLEGTIRVRDVVGDRELFAAPFDKLWRWSGVLGVTKGMGDMVAETAARIANSVARANGWQPPATATR